VVIHPGTAAEEIKIGSNVHTLAGCLFIRNIAMCFDKTLAPAGERRHSKTI
jgi:hypothetical protein